MSGLDGLLGAMPCSPSFVLGDCMDARNLQENAIGDSQSPEQ